MKKTLLATAIAGALGVSAAAQAATVYDQDGTRLDIYGRIALGVEGGGEKENEEGQKADGSEFRDVFSRFGLRGTQQLTPDLTAFGNFEVRPRMDHVNNDGQQVRNSFLGLRSESVGAIQAGNFDSFYLNTVAAPFDVYLNRGNELLGGAHQARGDSIGYISPNLEGFQVFLMGKHFSGNTTARDNAPEEPRGSLWNTAGGAVYEIDALRLALGYAQDRTRVSGGTQDEDSAGVGNIFTPGENIYGGTASFEFMPGLSARAGYEYQSDNNDKIGVGVSYAIASWAFNLDYYHIRAKGEHKDFLNEGDADTSRDSWAAGAYYQISPNFDVFAEVQNADQQSITLFNETADDLRATRDSTYWLTGARYHF
jgi:predicted porin